MLLTLPNGRLQNSPNFCLFKNEQAVKQKVWNEAKNTERDSQALRARARTTITPRFTDFFTDFEEKKNRLFRSLPKGYSEVNLQMLKRRG